MSQVSTRLRTSKQFAKVYSKGSSHRGRYLVIFVLPNELAVHRFGVTASRRAVGNSVHRNRVKRLLREAYRLNFEFVAAILQSHDIVVNARRSLVDAKCQDAIDDMRRIFLKLSSSDCERLQEGKQE